MYFAMITCVINEEYAHETNQSDVTPVADPPLLLADG